MGLESPTYVSDLVPTNPLATDQKSVGDDHLRAIKSVLRTTFPNATKPLYFPTTQIKIANYSVLSTQDKVTFLCDTGGGAFTMTLPVLAAGDAGWECYIIKTTLNTNPVMIAPASGTLSSGPYTTTAARRCIPRHRTICFWSGTEWFLNRAVHAPINTLIQYYGTFLQYGYEWPNGQTLASASTLYREFYAENGSSAVVVDKRGLFYAVDDDMGGAAAGRLANNILGGISTLGSTTLGSIGGEPSHLLDIFETPVAGIAVAAGPAVSVLTSGTCNVHNNLPPFRVMSELLVVE